MPEDYIQLTPEEAAQASADAQPAPQEVGQPIELSPADLKEAEANAQPDGGQDVFSGSAEDLAQVERDNPGFILGHLSQNPALQGDLPTFRKAADAMAIVGDDPLTSLKELPGQIGRGAVSVIKWPWRVAQTFGKGVKAAALLSKGAATDDAETLKKARLLEGELSAGLESEVTGLGHLGGGLVNYLHRKATGQTFQGMTPEDKDLHLQNLLSKFRTSQEILRGEGPATQMFGNLNADPEQQLKNIQAEGGVVRPEEAANVAEAGIVTLPVLGAASKAVRAVIPEAVAAPARQMGQQLAELGTKTFGGAVNVAGKLISGPTKVVQKALESKPAEVTGGVIGAYTGAHVGAEHLPIPGVGAVVGAVKGYNIGSKVAAEGSKFLDPLTKAGENLTEAGKGVSSTVPTNVSTPGSTAISLVDSTAPPLPVIPASVPKTAGAQLVKDLFEAAPGAAASIAEGATFDAAALAAAETPQEKEGVGMGAVFGALGAGRKLFSHSLSGQLIAARDIPTASVSSSGRFAPLDQMHNQAMASLPEGQQRYLNIARMFLSSQGHPTDVYASPSKEATVQALTQMGVDPATANTLSSQGNFNFNLPSGERVAIVQDPSTAPHEASHPLEFLLGDETNNHLDQTIQNDPLYKNNWDAIGDYYSQLLAGNDPSKPYSGDWRSYLKDSWGIENPDQYITREIRAEVVDTVLKHNGPELLKDRGALGAAARAAAKVVSFFGGNPLADRTSQDLKFPLSFKTASEVTKSLEGRKVSAIEDESVIGSDRARRGQPSGVPVTPQQREAARDDARQMAAALPDNVLPGELQSPREAAGVLAEGLGSGSGVKLDRRGAPGEPSAGLLADLKTRRAVIEEFRTMPDSAKQGMEKLVFPERFRTTKRSGLQVGSWVPSVFAANAHRLARTLSISPELSALSPYPIDPTTKTFTNEGWKQLYADAATQVQNYKAGRTGAGEPLVVPKGATDKGFYAPPLGKGAGPLEQGKADFINMLFGQDVPNTARVTSNRLPLNVAGQLVSEATKPGRVEPLVVPRQKGVFTGAQAEGLGIAGQELKEVNPLRNDIYGALKAKGISQPSFFSAFQWINTKDLMKAELAPEQPEFRGNTLTLQAGFSPKVGDQVEIEGPSGKKYTARFDGVQDFSALKPGLIKHQLTSLEDLKGDGGPTPGSTTYKESLEQKGFKFPNWQASPSVRDIADQYKQKSGIQSEAPKEVLPVNRETAKQLADFYQEAAHAPESPEVKASYDALTSETVEQMKTIQDAGYTVEPWDKEGEPYKNSSEMVQDVNQNKHLFYKPTEGAFGEGEKPLDNLMLAPSGLEEFPTMNDVFRAVHDFFGHAKEGHQFGPKGEFNAWREHSSMYSEAAQGALAAETLAQNSWVNFGQHLRNAEGGIIERGQPGYVAPQDRPFAEQKNTVVPEELRRQSVAPQFAPSTDPRAVKTAAVRDEDTGKVYEGSWHGEATDVMMNAKHPGVSPEEWYNLNPNILDGFVTNSGEFLTRTQAYDRAVELRQYKPENKQYGNPYDRELEDEVGLESTLFKAKRQFSPSKWDKYNVPPPPKRKQNEFTLKEGPGLFSKAWILPGGRIAQLGSQEHHDYFNTNPDVAKKYGIRQVKGEQYDAADNRVDALKQGFARINYEKNNGVLTIEARQKDWPSLQESVRKFVEANLNKIDTMDVHLLNDKANKAVQSEGVQLFTYPADEKMQNIPFISAPSKTTSTSPQSSSEAQFSPATPEKDLFGEPVPKKLLSTAEQAAMTNKQIEEYYPEAVIPARRDQSIQSDVTNAPLVKGLSEPEAIQKYADKLIQFAEKYKDDPAFKHGEKWYSEFTPRLEKAFGDDAPIFAELLAATSPNTSPETNFAFALEALEGFKSGRYDKILKKYKEGLEKVQKGTWTRLYNKMVEGGYIESPPKEPTPAAFMEGWIARHNLVPLKSNGKRIGMHSRAVMKVLSRTWLQNTSGPKTQNFVQNLLGKSNEATIDVWADRTMRRLGYEGFKERWRILPKNGTGIPDKDFFYAQKAFKAAAERIGMTASQLQGALWFAEKKLWADNGWARLDLGDFRKELDRTAELKQKMQENLRPTEADLQDLPVRGNYDR